ncbi:SGNH/GDSL hydrolase family protein [Prevotella veroralis]|uniref:GDSL-like protein n=1 Tax=Prevotella veroralis F0319 TaxID=649761 RepID=C9MNL5_9BACT|nr:SGNH/GDSL hydrolase family protein [Prevotella veroralis]EEX18668.1 GDSL-like protein [Prevotella veroralis F0319]QUB40545.1 SGNH/GDSL hydrolase family protein [Prevotella veroralis]
MTRKILLVLLLFIALTIQAQQPHWVGTWACAPQTVDKSFMPYNNQMTNRSVRQVVKVSIGGNVIRLQLSNELSSEPVEITSVYIAKAGNGPEIYKTSAKYLQFGKKRQVVIPAGKAVFSDALKFKLQPLERVSITINYLKAPKEPTVHMGSRTTSYILRGVTNSYTDFTTAFKEDHWFNISAIDVLDATASSIAILGNSITDGKGSTTNAQDRWPDFLSAALNNGAGFNLFKVGKTGILNLGIGNNRILSVGLGAPGKERFDRDILAQRGLRAVIIFEAINDIGTSTNPDETARKLVEAYQVMIKKARQRGLKVYMGTITPFRGCRGYFTEEREKARKIVNSWIRTTHEIDGFIDFDALMRDPSAPEQLRREWQIGDWLHPNPAGYKQMGEYAARFLM